MIEWTAEDRTGKVRNGGLTPTIVRLNTFLFFLLLVLTPGNNGLQSRQPLCQNKSYTSKPRVHSGFDNKSTNEVPGRSNKNRTQWPTYFLPAPLRISPSQMRNGRARGRHSPGARLPSESSWSVGFSGCSSPWAWSLQQAQPRSCLPPRRFARLVLLRDVL